MTDIKDLLNKVSSVLDDKPISGLLSKKALINNGKGTEVTDILGWNCIVRADDGTCYSFYVAQSGFGMTQPVKIQCPLGLRVIPSYSIDIEKAIKKLNERDCGNTFIDIELFWPLVPECKEPYWHFRLTLGNEVIIGANSGSGGCHTIEKLLSKKQETDVSDININVGEWTKVELKDNGGSTGYSWVIGHKPDGLWLVDINYIPPEPPVSFGKPGTRVFTFYGAEKCQDSIQFINVQLWDPKTAEITTYAVKVN
jgi:predicted secreted protein